MVKASYDAICEMHPPARKGKDSEYPCAEATVKGLKSNKSEWNRGIPPPSPMGDGAFLFFRCLRPLLKES